MTFKNTSLSVSRLKKFEQCPKAFRLRYVDQLPAESSGEPGEFGTLLHSVLERIYGWVVAVEHSGLVPDAVVTESFGIEFEAAPPIISSLGLYQEGLELVRRYVAQHPDVDHSRVLGTEVKFEIQIGPFGVTGYIDRTEREDEETALLLDYKSSRMLYTQSEVESDLQASVYLIAARRLYPWAKKFKFAFDMLRFGQRLYAERTDDQLSVVEDYVVALGKRTERTDEVYPAVLNPNCPYCDHKRYCSEYDEALLGNLDITKTDSDGIEEVAAERERMHVIAKIAYSRKDALERILRARVNERGPFSAAGRNYRLIPIYSIEYPVRRTLEVLAEESGKPAEEVRDAILVVDRGAMREFVEKIDPPPDGFARKKTARTRLIEAHLEALATKTPGKARFDSQSVKGAQVELVAAAEQPEPAQLPEGEKPKKKRVSRKKKNSSVNPTFASLPLNDLRCVICGEPQRSVPGGAACANGHGGAEGTSA